MRAVATALATVRDPDSRARIVEWARQHFAPPAVSTALRITDGSSDIAIASAPTRVADFSALAIGEDLFDSDVQEGPRHTVPFVPVDHGSHSRADSWRRPAATRFMFESQIRHVARAFRRIGRKWQRAS